MDNQYLERWIQDLIEHDKLYQFYKSQQFRRLRSHVLEIDRNICSNCGNHNATIAHHVNHVRDHPSLALSVYWANPETRRKERNIVSVCKRCHNVLHPEKFSGADGDSKSPRKEINNERW